MLVTVGRFRGVIGPSAVFLLDSAPPRGPEASSAGDRDKGAIRPWVYRDRELILTQ